MQSGCDVDAIWMRSGCGLDAVWMRSGCGLDANKIFKDKSKCGFRHEETKLLRYKDVDRVQNLHLQVLRIYLRPLLYLEHIDLQNFKILANKNQSLYQILSDTDSGTFYRYQIFSIPVPRLLFSTNLSRYRFRYHQKNEKFSVLGIPGTGTSHSAKE